MLDGFLKLQKKIGFIKALNYGLKAASLMFINKIKGSYSQKGEDLIIDKLLNYKSKGFYVDIGAHHPSKLSNTKRFYRRGWNGINIEPNPSMYKLFLSERATDNNINIGISNTRGVLNFYEFKESAMSTFSYIHVKRYISLGYKLKLKHRIKVNTLSQVLSQNNIKQIDFISIDTEGNEMKVLKSNNWKRFRPKVLCIETSEHDISLTQSNNMKNEISGYLAKHGYIEYFSNNLNTIYIDQSFYTSK